MLLILQDKELHLLRLFALKIVMRVQLKISRVKYCKRNIMRRYFRPTPSKNQSFSS